MSKIQFGTDGWRAVIARDFTFDNLNRVTYATGKWLFQFSEKPTVMLGYDCRFNGRLFAQAVANQLAQMGIRVFLTPGFSSTPMVSLATAQRQTTAGIIITASHNPPEYSGYKVKGNYGGPATPAMITEIENLIPEAPQPVEDKFDELLTQRKIEYYDAEALYINHLRQSFDIDAIRNANISIGYDAMYGAGQNAVRKLLPKATLLHCDYNPSFMGQAPEPIEKNLQPFETLIREQKLSVGLATDGDADRIGLYDENAQFVDSHHIILILIHYLHKYKKETGKVACSFSCTSKIQKICQDYGLPLEVTKIGFKHICEIMIQEKVLVGGEESGGISVLGHVPERDGIYIGLMIMEFMAKTGKKLTELIQELYEVIGSFSVQRQDLHLAETLKQAIMVCCRENSYPKFGDYHVTQVDTLDGYKFWLSDSTWVMIRPSGTEPVLRIYAEGATKQQANDILEKTIATILA
ncbi:MAG: phosphoglucomutase/phosphomannomutase family protein [Bacteroidia bacterium]|nr:phosphoglucomutase/phosphomannomutase family protein [Bacteroidia bacterium]